ncbi:MAG: hypothetical protein ACI81W_001417, partial [Saprospiraceae bacterium]
DDLDDLEAVNYDAEFAIPLFSGTASFNDVLKNFDEDTYITILPDGLIQLNYKGNVVAKSSTDIFEGFPVLPFLVIDTVVGIGFNVPGSIDIDLAVLKQGTVEWGYQMKHGEELIVKVSIPNAIKDGQIFEKVKGHIAAAEFFIQPPIDMTGYTLFPTNDSIFIRYQAYRPDVGYADTLTNFVMIFKDFEASYVEGYLGNDLYELPRDTIEIDFFENWTRGDIYFAEPTILIGVENSFGFPVRSKTNILSILTVGGDSIGLESSFIESGIDFAYPSLDEVGQAKATNFYFDHENSNITEIIGAGPVSVDYDLDAIPNPDSDTTIRGFLTDSSFFKVQVEVNLPIYGTAIGFEARDTFSVDFSEYEDADHVEFKLIADNGIPVEVGLQAYFADRDGNVLDSLFIPADVIMEAAPVDGGGLVTSRVEKTTYATINNERFQKIKAAKNIFLNASFSTTNNGIDEVKIFSDQNVAFRMGMKIGIKK